MHHHALSALQWAGAGWGSMGSWRRLGSHVVAGWGPMGSQAGAPRPPPRMSLTCRSQSSWFVLSDDEKANPRLLAVPPGVVGERGVAAAFGAERSSQSSLGSGRELRIDSIMERRSFCTDASFWMTSSGGTAISDLRLG